MQSPNSNLLQLSPPNNVHLSDSYLIKSLDNAHPTTSRHRYFLSWKYHVSITDNIYFRSCHTSWLSTHTFIPFSIYTFHIIILS